MRYRRPDLEVCIIKENYLHEQKREIEYGRRALKIGFTVIRNLHYFQEVSPIYEQLRRYALSIEVYEFYDKILVEPICYNVDG